MLPWKPPWSSFRPEMRSCGRGRAGGRRRVRRRGWSGGGLVSPGLPGAPDTQRAALQYTTERKTAWLAGLGQPEGGGAPSGGATGGRSGARSRISSAMGGAAALCEATEGHLFAGSVRGSRKGWDRGVSRGKTHVCKHIDEPAEEDDTKEVQNGLGRVFEAERPVHVLAEKNVGEARPCKTSHRRRRDVTTWEHTAAMHWGADLWHGASKTATRTTRVLGRSTNPRFAFFARCSGKMCDLTRTDAADAPVPAAAVAGNRKQPPTPGSEVAGRHELGQCPSVQPSSEGLDGDGSLRERQLRRRHVARLPLLLGRELAIHVRSELWLSWHSGLHVGDGLLLERRRRRRNGLLLGSLGTLARSVDVPLLFFTPSKLVVRIRRGHDEVDLNQPVRAVDVCASACACACVSPSKPRSIDLPNPKWSTRSGLVASLPWRYRQTIS